MSRTPSRLSNVSLNPSSREIAYAINYLLNSGLVGFATGDGGTVTQATNKSTDVTLNRRCGQITTSNSSIPSGSTAAFFLHSTFISATDLVIVQLQSAGGGAHGILDYVVRSGQIIDGQAAISITNNSAGALAETLVLNFAVIKLVNA